MPLVPAEHCLNCGHHESNHDTAGWCEVEISDHGILDCECARLRLCAACLGDPEAHDLHVCGKEPFA